VVVHARCRYLAQGLRLTTGEFAVNFHTLPEKSEHVVPDGSDRFPSFDCGLTFDVSKQRADVLEAALGLGRSNVHGELTAAKVVTERRRWVQDKATVGAQVPAFSHACLLADELEIVDVDTEYKLESTVAEQALPAGDGLKITLRELLGEVVSPVFATHRVAI